MTDKFVVKFSDLVEKNGKTIKENNMELTHKYPLGELVEVEIDLYNREYSETEEKTAEVNLKGTCTLYIVGHMRDCDGTPLYMLSSIPVLYPKNTTLFSKEWLHYNAVAKFVEFGYNEERLKPVGKNRQLYNSIPEYFGV